MTPDRNEQPGARFGRWVVRNRFVVLLLTLLVTVAMGAGLKNFGFDNDYRVFFGKDNPQLLAFDALENIYAKNDNVLFTIAPSSGEAFTSETLTIVSALTERAWKLPYARRVDAVTNFQSSRAEGDDLIVEDLVSDPSSVTEEELARALETALLEPQLDNRLITAASHVTGVNVTLELPGESPFEVTEVAAAARDLAREFMDTYPIDIHLTGVAMLNNAFAENAQQDMQSLVPLMFAAIVLGAVFFLRSISGALATLVIIVLSTVAAMGLASWFGIRITPASSIAPTMVMTLAVADSVHVLVSMLAAMRSGMTKHDAIAESLRVNIQPVVITSVTTAIGLLSLNFSDSPPFRDLGNISAMGVMAALVFSITTLPALMAVVPVRQKVRSHENEWGMSRLADFVLSRRRPLLWGSIAVVLVIVSFVPRNELNDQFIGYFDDRVAFRVDTDFTTDNLTGIYQIDFNLGAHESGGISEPEYLRKLDEFDSWMREQPGVRQVQSLSYVIKRLNRNMHGDDPSYFRLPDSRELAAQYLLLYEMSLPFGLDLNNQINVDKSASRFSVVLDDMTANDMRALTAKSEEWLAANTPDSMFSHGIGPVIMFAYISERNVKSMLVGTAVALVLISVCLVFALRSVKYGVLSLIPNLIPALLTFGIWGMFVREVNLGLANVMALSLGIVADDTVHFLSKYLRARRERGIAAEDAVRYAFTSVGKALVITSIILVVGFWVMTRSAFALNSNMGWFTLITIAVALIADFLLLPAILLKVDRNGRDPVGAEAPAWQPAPSRAT